MFEPSFYQINKNFDSNLSSFVSFDPQLDYVLRFVLDGWEVNAPDGNRFLQASNAIGTVLAAVGDLSLYDVKGVLFQKVAPGQIVGYFSPSWYVVSMNEGYTDTLTASDGTWVVDLVFHPKHAERSWTNVQKWTEALAVTLQGSRGTPRVYCAGLLALDGQETVEESVKGEFFSAITFWNVRSAFYEIFIGTLEKPVVRQINEPPLTGWTDFPPYVGQDGLGIALGSAIKVNALTPIAVQGTIQPIAPVPPTGTPSQTPPGPAAAAFPMTAVDWQSLSTPNKLVAAGVGAAIVTAAVMAWRFFKEE